MIPTKEDARAILEPYHPLIRRVIEQGWAEWKLIRAYRVQHEMAPILYNRVICNYVHDAIARIGILAFGAEAKIRVVIEPQTFKIQFPGIIARIKKGDDEHLGMNIPTQAVLAFVEADGLLPGMPPETAKVEIIWIPNEIWTDIDRILVIARDGDRLIWEYDIERSEPSAEVVPFPSPTGPDTDGSPMVKPKSPAKPDTKQQ